MRRLVTLCVIGGLLTFACSAQSTGTGSPTNEKQSAVKPVAQPNNAALSGARLALSDLPAGWAAPPSEMDLLNAAEFQAAFCDAEMSPREAHSVFLKDLNDFSFHQVGVFATDAKAKNALASFRRITTCPSANTGAKPEPGDKVSIRVIPLAPPQAGDEAAGLHVTRSVSNAGTGLSLTSNFALVYVRRANLVSRLNLMAGGALGSSEFSPALLGNLVKKIDSRLSLLLAG